jgi:hypothetical protein
LLLIGIIAAAGQDNDMIRVQHERDIAACHRKLSAGQFKRRKEFAICVNTANAKGWSRTSNWDLFQNAAARELVAAERFDRGVLTEAEYLAARTSIKADLMTEVAKREAYRALARPPPYQPPQPQGPVTCFTTGRLTTCY